VFTDPPYDAQTHKYNRSTAGGGELVKGLPFPGLSPEALRVSLCELGRVSDRWVIATLPLSEAVSLQTDPPSGLRVLRVGVWLKTDPMPQLTGDRPAHGWDAIVYMHRVDTAPRWSGGGKHGNYVSKLDRSSGHPTPKPVPMLADWCRRFTEPGDLILDPYAGGAPTLIAARQTGRRAIGIELDAEYCASAAKRLAAAPLFADL
jgi:site-specific DNA-methyltransferase (adenine-specific)